MPDYTLLVSDASTGANLAELPWSGMQRSRVLSGVGQLTCSLPLDHWAVTEDNLGQLRSSPDREVTLWRDSEAVWNGPITGTDCSWSDTTFNLVARDSLWYLAKRVLEIDKPYAAWDVFDIVRDLITYMTTKEGTGDDGMTLGDDIIAGLPRFAVSPASTDAGATMDADFSGASRHTIQECFDFVANDPETGFEYKLDVSSGTTWRSCQRTLVLGYPQLGSTLTRPMTELLLADYARSGDWERGGSRFHVIGAGYTKTLQSASAVSNGVLLTEVVDDMTDTSDHGFVNARARDLRRLARSPVRAFTLSYIPDDVLSYGAVDLGDTVPFDVRTPAVLSITADNRRVTQEDVTCDVDGSELVTVTLNDPLTDLGT